MINANLRPPIYDPEAVQPMRDELTFMGFQEMTTPDEVHNKLKAKDGKVKLVVINSVCGCAAGSARPGATHAVMHNKIPAELLTSFAGQERDAVDTVRNDYLKGFPPSSPSMALVKDGEVLYMMPRHHIEGRSAQQVADALIDQFEKFCETEGPSVTEEEYAKLVHARACGSKIPLNN